MSAKKYAIPTPVQFDRLYAGPLDKYEVFESYSEALVYAQGPISYPGQTIGVKRTGLKEDVYVINQDKSMSRLMIQREDIRLVLKKENWIGEVPYEQTLAVPYLEATDNCIISLSETVTDPQVVREIVNAKIGDTIQEEGSIRFIARGDKPKVDIPITITIGSVVSAVEIPNNVNDNTNHTVVIAKKDAWVGTKPPYTQELHVFGVRPDSNGTIGINPDSSFYTINSLAASTAGVKRFSQANNTITIAAMNSKPTRDLEILVVWGDEIVVWENTDTFEDFNTSLDLVLKANEWSVDRPYTQTIRVEGLSEYHTGAIGLSTNCTPEEAETAINAGLELIEQGAGYVVVEAKDIKPEIDIPIYLTYGSNITVISSPEYVGEANRHVDTIAYSSKWIECPDGWEQTVDVEGITSNSIGTMGLKNGASELQAYNAAVARIKITKVYDNKVVLTATKIRPNINIPLCFVFGRNINVTKYPGVIGKVTVDTNYIAFDDSTINSGYSTLQQLLEHFNKTKIGFADTVDNLESYDSDNPLSANMGRKLNEEKVAYTDIVDKLYEDNNILSPENIESKLHQYLPDKYIISKAISGTTASIINRSNPNIQITAEQISRDISYNTVFVRGQSAQEEVSFDLQLNRLSAVGGLVPNTTYLLQVQTNKTSEILSVYDINPNNIKINDNDKFIYGEYTYHNLIDNALSYKFNKDNTWVFRTGENPFDRLTISMRYTGIMSGQDTIAEIKIVELQPMESEWKSEDVLSARMGKFLSNSKVDRSDIVDNLSSSVAYKISNSVPIPVATVSGLNLYTFIDSNNYVNIRPTSTLNVTSDQIEINVNISRFELYNDSVYILNIKPNEDMPITYIPTSYYDLSSSNAFSFDKAGSIQEGEQIGFNAAYTWEIRPVDTVTNINIKFRIQINEVINSGDLVQIQLFKVEPTVKVLSARMGNYLDNTKINYTDTVDNLESHSPIHPLSANMGRQLKGSVTSLESRIGIIEDQASADKIKNMQTSINNLETEYMSLNNTLENNGLYDVVFKVQSNQPNSIAGKNVIWIKI